MEDQSVTVSLLYLAENLTVSTVQEPPKAIFFLKYLSKDQNATAFHTNFEIKLERTGNYIDQPSYIRLTEVGLGWLHLSWGSNTLSRADDGGSQALTVLSECTKTQSTNLSFEGTSRCPQRSPADAEMSTQ